MGVKLEKSLTGVEYFRSILEEIVNVNILEQGIIIYLLFSKGSVFNSVSGMSPLNDLRSSLPLKGRGRGLGRRPAILMGKSPIWLSFSYSTRTAFRYKPSRDTRHNFRCGSNVKIGLPVVIPRQDQVHFSIVGRSSADIGHDTDRWPRGWVTCQFLKAAHNFSAWRWCFHRFGACWFPSEEMSRYSRPPNSSLYVRNLHRDTRWG